MKVRAYIEATYEIDLSDSRLQEAYGVSSELEVLEQEGQFLEGDGTYLLEMLANEETDVRLITLAVVEIADSSDPEPLPSDAELAS